MFADDATLNSADSHIFNDGVFDVEEVLESLNLAHNEHSFKGEESQELSSAIVVVLHIRHRVRIFYQSFIFCQKSSAIGTDKNTVEMWSDELLNYKISCLRKEGDTCVIHSQMSFEIFITVVRGQN